MRGKSPHIDSLSIPALLTIRQDGKCPAFSSLIRRKRTRKELLASPRISSPDKVVTSLQVHQNDCRYLLSGSGDGIVSVYDLSKWGANERPLGDSDKGDIHTPIARSLHVSQHSQQIDNPLQVAQGHSLSVISARWYPVDSGAFISASTDGLLLVWDTNEMVPVANLEPFKFDGQSLPENTIARPSCMEISSKAGHLAAVGSRLIRSVKLCDIRTGTCSHSLTGHRAGITCVQWSPLSEFTLASGGYDGCIRLWDIRKSGSGGCLAVLNHDAQPDLSTSTGYQPDYGHLVRRRRKRKQSQAVGPNDYRRAEEASAVSVEGGFVSGLEFAASGRWLVNSCSTGELQLWDLTSPTCHLIPRRFQSPNGGLPVHKVKSTQAQFPIVVSERHVWIKKSSHIMQYSLDLGGKPKQVLKGHLMDVEALTEVPDTGDLLSSSRDGLVLTWGFPPPARRRQATADSDSW